MTRHSLAALVRQTWQVAGNEDTWQKPWQYGTSHQWTPNERIDTFVRQYYPVILPVVHGAVPHDAPYMEHNRDTGAEELHMPPRETFATASEYYAGLLHELSHAAGYRLHRYMPNAFDEIFDTGASAREEAAAEASAYTLLHHFRASSEATDDNSARYIAGWLRSQRKDLDDVLVDAAQRVEYLLGKVQHG